MTDIETITWTAREILPWHQRSWLIKAMEMLRWDFKQIGAKLPKVVDIQVDFPSCNIGITWLGTYHYNAGCHQIFINPTVEGLRALDILVHELVHAIAEDLPWEDGHGERFMDIAEAIGMNDGGPTAVAEEVLLTRLREIQQILGSYPLVFDFV